MNSNQTKIGRNDPCPCGSGLKYKNCCFPKTVSPTVDIKARYLKQYKIRLKDEADIEGIRKAGKLVIDTLDMVEERLRPGITSNDINTWVHEFTLQHKAIPAPLNYRGFPKSVCVSINEVVVHGIPGQRVIQDGDIVNVDVTPILNGYYADANKTFFVGTPGPDAVRIVTVARECLRIGVNQVKPGNTIGDIGWAIQQYAEGQGCSVVREFVGHGVGFDFHENPQVPHYGRPRTGVTMAPGMVFTVEPMINLGKRDIVILKDGWTAVTQDGSLSAQFEQTVLVTEDGYESLTPYAI
ncbi:MAG: type I methionyl aminopeptidase [Candidatus Zhuqueibacterota bacterium]